MLGQEKSGASHRGLGEGVGVGRCGEGRTSIVECQAGKNPPFQPSLHVRALNGAGEEEWRDETGTTTPLHAPLQDARCALDDGLAGPVNVHPCILTVTFDTRPRTLLLPRWLVRCLTTGAYVPVRLHDFLDLTRAVVVKFIVHGVSFPRSLLFVGARPHTVIEQKIK